MSDFSNDDESTMSEIASFIKFNSKLEYNTITRRVENHEEPIDDRFMDSIYIRAKQAIGKEVTKTDVNAIINSDIIPDYCPVQRWLEDRKHFPHKPEIIDELLNTIPYKNPNAKEFIKHWLLGIPATYSGEIVRLVLVLCGAQETGKTYWMRHLLPDSLKAYYSESNLMDESESVLIMSSSLINMDDEFGGKSRKDAVKFKELTSKAVFNVRLKYGRTVTSLRRLAMLAGTTNETEILNDSTGNTRILPVEFHEKYNFELYNSIDKEQLFLEIFRAYERGESWKLSEKAKETLSSLNQIHQIADIESELIDMYIEPNDTPYHSDILSATEIKSYIEKNSQQKISIKKLGESLKKSYPCVVKKVNGKTKRGYEVRFLNSQSDNNPF